jgi:hypothetical protein
MYVLLLSFIIHLISRRRRDVLCLYREMNRMQDFRFSLYFRQQNERRV